MERLKKGPKKQESNTIYVKVCGEDSDYATLFPVEENGELYLDDIRKRFPHADGLNFYDHNGKT